MDAILAAAYPDLSRARIQRLIESGGVTVNGETVRKSGQLKTGSVVALTIEPVAHQAPAADFDLHILYEDDELLAVDKPPGLAVHGAPGDQGPSVAGWFLSHYATAASLFDAERPGIVHRLDKDTSGVLLLAKTPAAQAALSKAFERRSTSKTYLAVCDGVPQQQRAVIDAAIARHPGDRTRMAITKRGRESRTGFELIADDGEHCFLVVRPETGRTHQIRVHLAAVDLPVRFDRVYGKGGGSRQLLHAYSIAVPHPAGGRLTITAPMPGDMYETLANDRMGAAAEPYRLMIAPTITADESHPDNDADEADDTDDE
ncbi:hypothetical protein AYO38_05150 [bacterium SCGC AG-212-C10]|nr:hypothetical protein AYO38_05150 [bacterium SCGC AG-212-C10]